MALASYYLFFGFPDETKFTIVPEIIFEGDTVTLMCETEVLSSNVSWHHVERHSDLQNNSRFSVYTFVLNNMTSISRLTIYNITQGDAGGISSNNWCRERNKKLIKKQAVEGVFGVFLSGKKSPGSTFQN